MKDHNTKFFHAFIVIRRKRNEVLHLKINEKNFHGVINLKREIRNHFVKRLSQEQIPAIDFVMDNHPRISNEQARLLESIPSREEVKKVE